TGSIEMASLDLGLLLTRDAAEVPPGGAQRKDPIGDLLKQPQTKPQVRGYKRRSGQLQDWSDDELDTRLLTMADADIKLSTREIVYHD
ncbi:hypothetical protein QSH65_24545, partial [Escherichia coli]|uniref:hypothetical protein n=1 Tax=Escherichia coli TaxID=562 RepID=UPI0027380B46